MGQNVVGINEQAIDNLILDIYDYADRINVILNSLEDTFDKYADCFMDASSSNFKYKLDQLKSNFPIVNNNIKSYADDLIKVKNSFVNVSVDMAQLIKNKALEAEADIEIL